MNVSGLTRTSLTILLAHRVRTAASVSAVFVGVAALILQAGVGQAVEQDLRGRMGEMGSNIVAVRARATEQLSGRMRQAGWATSLLPSDGELLRRELPGIRHLTGIATFVKPVRFANTTRVVPVVGVDPDFFPLQRLTPAAGRMFTPEEDRGRVRVAVLGANPARQLFNLENPIGQQVRIAGVPFRVIGVTAEKGLGLLGGDLDENVYVPLATLLSRVVHRAWLDAILAQTESSASLPGLRLRIFVILRQAHRLPSSWPDDFVVQDPAAVLAAERSVGRSYRMLLESIAAVFLATGGIGIIAVMLMGVRERTQEIGVRRAIGATRRAILLQFLFEAGLLTAFAGISAGLVALPANAIVCRLAGWPVVWPTTCTFLAIGFSVGLGLLCGVAPAVHAARSQPAVALRVQN